MCHCYVFRGHYVVCTGDPKSSSANRNDKWPVCAMARLFTWCGERQECVCVCVCGCVGERLRDGTRCETWS